MPDKTKTADKPMRAPVDGASSTGDGRSVVLSINGVPLSINGITLGIRVRAEEDQTTED